MHLLSRSIHLCTLRCINVLLPTTSHLNNLLLVVIFHPVWAVLWMQHVCVHVCVHACHAWLLLGKWSWEHCGSRTISLVSLASNHTLCSLSALGSGDGTEERDRRKRRRRRGVWWELWNGDGEVRSKRVRLRVRSIKRGEGRKTWAMRAVRRE